MDKQLFFLLETFFFLSGINLSSSNRGHFHYEKEVPNIMCITFHIQCKAQIRLSDQEDRKGCSHENTTDSLGLEYLQRFFTCPLRGSKFTLKIKLPSGTLVSFSLLLPLL
jgi:hypothetical protein